MIKDLIEDVLFISFLEFGIVGIAIPAFLFYPVLRRISRGEWRSLCSWIDFVSFFAIHIIWFYGFIHDFNRRGAGMFLDIVVLGVAYGVLVLLRCLFVWRHPEWRTRIAMLSFFILVAITIILTWFINLASVE